MARRRKIPAKKHHGVKDPEQQREQREKKIKHKVNYYKRQDFLIIKRI